MRKFKHWLCFFLAFTIFTAAACEQVKLFIQLQMTAPKIGRTPTYWIIPLKKHEILLFSNVIVIHETSEKEEIDDYRSGELFRDEIGNLYEEHVIDCEGVNMKIDKNDHTFEIFGQKFSYEDFDQHKEENTLVVFVNDNKIVSQTQDANEIHSFILNYSRSRSEEDHEILSEAIEELRQNIESLPSDDSI